MDPIETEYRGHKIVIRDAALERLSQQPTPQRIIEVDGVDVTSRCRVSDADEEKLEAAKRFVDRIYPKGKSEPDGKTPV